MALSAAQIDRLSRLLSSAVDLHQLDRFVSLATGDRLFVEYVGPGLPLRPTIEKLIQALEQDGTTFFLAAVLYREKPFRNDLRQYLVQLFPEAASGRTLADLQFEAQSGGQGRDDFPAGSGPGLQRLIRPQLKMLDLRQWLDKADRISHQVCRIEVDNAGLGSGFLVGDGRVLTNWHVVDLARQMGGLSRLAARFDYHRGAQGTEAGEPIPVAGIIDERPCSPAELTGGADVLPAADELDYALLQLSKGTAERGAVPVRPAPPVAANDPLILVQHPQGETLKIALDDSAVEGFVHDGRRLRYRTNTEPGSSGSPCFTFDLDLVALHHLGDPSFGAPKYNQGIPIDLVRASIEARTGAPPG